MPIHVHRLFGLWTSRRRKYARLWFRPPPLLEKIMASKTSDQSLLKLCQLFHLLSDKNRLRMVLMLAEGERDVTSLCKELHLAQPTVSHHLGLLRMNKVIANKRPGRR